MHDITLLTLFTFCLEINSIDWLNPDHNMSYTNYFEKGRMPFSENHLKHLTDLSCKFLTQVVFKVFL